MMGLFEHWPYVNFHDLNLDWIIKEIPKVYASRDEAQASAEAAAESAAASQLSADASQASADASQLSAEASELSAGSSQSYAQESLQHANDAAETVSNTLNQINLLQSRVDNIIPEGTQTEGNTELIDIRVGANGTTYDSAGNAVRGQVSDLKSALDNTNNVYKNVVVVSSNNLFDPRPLVDLPGYVYSDDVISGKLETVHLYYGNTYYPLGFSFDPAKNYTLGLDAKISGVTTGTGLQVLVKYTDDTVTAITVPNATSDWTHFLVKTYKPVAGINLTYGGYGNNTLYLKNIMLVEGLEDKPFTQYLTAVDLIARQEIENVNQEIENINQEIENINQEIKPKSATYDFSNKQIGSTYVGVDATALIKNGETYSLKITAPENDENTEYFLFYDANGERLIQTASLTGSGSRTVTFNNTYGRDAVRVEMVLVEVNAQSVYTVEFSMNSSLYNQIDELDERVDELERGVTPDIAVPEYFEANVATAIATAQSAIQSAGINGETFIFLSDIHWENNERHSPALVKAVTDALPIENTVYGGDTFNGGEQATVIGYMNDVRQKFTKASPHFLAVYGNHDGNQLDGGTAFTHNEFYTFMQKQADYYVEYEAPCYFFMDNKTTKTRYIILDSGTGNPSTASAQLTWLQSILSNAPSGWHFLVFCHVIFYPESGGSYSDPSTWVMSPFMTNVCSALDTFNTSSSGKKVEAVFGGHTHLDHNTTTSGGIPIIIIDCDTKQTASSNPQTAGTIDEQCIDIVTVDYSSEKITCARIGRGVSRIINY